MNILFFQWRYHTNRHPMVKALIRNGHNVKYISQYSDPKAENHSIIEPYVIGYSNIFKFFSKLLNKSGPTTRKRYGWPPLVELWREINEFDPDILIVRDYYPVSVLLLVIANIHSSNVIIEELIPKYRNISMKKHVFKKTYQYIFNNPIVTITPINKIENFDGSAPENIYYVPYPVDMDLYKSKEENKSTGRKAIKIINVGTFSQKRKNHLLLLKAFNHIRNEYNIKLTLVGHLKNRQNEYYQQILTYIQENDLSDDVEIKVNMNHEDLQKEYMRHDLFVFPSSKEPLGMAGLEGLAAGLPLICSNRAGVSSYITPDYNGYLFDEGSIEDLVDKIEKLVSSDEKRLEMSNNSLNYVEKEHNLSKFSSRIEYIIKKEFRNE